MYSMHALIIIYMHAVACEPPLLKLFSQFSSITCRFHVYDIDTKYHDVPTKVCSKTSFIQFFLTEARVQSASIYCCCSVRIL